MREGEKAFDSERPPDRPPRFAALRRRAAAARAAAFERWSRLRESFQHHASSRVVQSATIATIATVALGGTGLGPYLEHVLFFRPVQKLAFVLGEGAKLAPELRLVVVDDRALAKLGRFPTFGEWQGIAKRLGALGFTRCLLIATPSLEADLGTVAPPPDALSTCELFVGAVGIENDQNLRATPSAALPAGLLLRGRLEHAAAKTARTLTLPPEHAATIKGIGTLDLEADATFNYARHVRDDLYMPNLAFLAASGLRIEDEGFVTERGRIPRSADDRVHVPFVAWRDVLGSAVPATAFFDATHARLAEPSEKLKKALDGGKVALLVADAHTGARFLEGPIGKIPSFVAVTSVVNAVIHHRFVYAPVAASVLMALLAAALTFAAQRRKTRSAAWLTLSAGGWSAVIAAGLWQAQGWILPGASFVLVAILLTAHRLTFDFVVALADRIRVEQELALGGMVQALMLPKARAGVVGPWRYDVTFQPYGALSGDWFQIFEAPPEAPSRLVILAIGDVVGKGASAALVTSTICSLWNFHEAAWRKGEIDVCRLVRELDAAVARTFRGHQNTTLSIVYLTETDIMVGAFGTQQWLVLEPGKALVRVRTPASELIGYGLRKEPKLEGVALSPGRVLVACTDGVLEGSTARLRLSEAVTALSAAEAARFPETVAALVGTIGAVDALPDDRTTVTVVRVA